MKYIQFAIMAVMLFGLAASPAFSNGLAFASDRSAECSQEDRDEDDCVEVHPDSDKTQSRDSPVDCNRGEDPTEVPESTDDCPNRYTP